MVVTNMRCDIALTKYRISQFVGWIKSLRQIKEGYVQGGRSCATHDRRLHRAFYASREPQQTLFVVKSVLLHFKHVSGVPFTAILVMICSSWLWLPIGTYKALHQFMNYNNMLMQKVGQSVRACFELPLWEDSSLAINWSCQTDFCSCLPGHYV